MYIQEIQILLQILLVFIGLYLSFFKSYFQEKGKNIATKEDVEEITSKVENIRHELHIRTESKLSLRAEERNALVEYYTKYNYWLETIISAQLSIIGVEDDLLFLEVNSTLTKAKFDFDVSKAKFDIFVRNDEVSALEMKTVIGALGMQHLIQLKIPELAQLNNTMSFNLKSTDMTSQLAKHKELLEGKTELIKDFQNRRVEMYKELIPHVKTLRDIIYKHISNLIS